MSLLQEQVSNSRLVTFRILFGLVMAAECWGAILTGLVKDVFISTPFNFTFIGFEWLAGLHGPVMYWYYVVMGLFGICVAAGFLYRITSLMLSLMWTAAYLSEKTHYNNHYYLMVLLCWIMAVMPAQRRASVDARIWPQIRTAVCRRWELWIFIVQVAIVYTFAAIAKVNADWLRAMPLKLWLANKGDIPLIGPLLRAPAAPWVMSYTGLFFDLLVVPLMLYRRTRLTAFILSMTFHLANSVIFQIGTFPYLALALSVFFFPAGIFERWLPGYGEPGTQQSRSTPTRLLLAGVYICWQIAVPLRHWLFPGDVAWTEEGHRMSWRMMLRSKTGYVNFRVVGSSGQEWIESPYTYLAPEQAADACKHPDICWQFVQHLKDVYRRKGFPDVSIFVLGQTSVNGSLSAPLFDPQTDLAHETWQPFRHHGWITDRPATP